jgi:glycopeptide antibiotics resistance protein
MVSGLAFAVFGPALIEFLKLFVYSRVFDATNLFAGVFGSLAGWYLGWRVRTAALAPWATAVRFGIFAPALLVAWLATVLYINWRPFNFTTDSTLFASDSSDVPMVGLRHMSLLPFVDYYWSNKYHLLDQSLLKGLSFLPLGVLLGMRSSAIYSPGAGRRAIMIAAILALVVEAGRYFLPDHFPNVTDLLIQCAGAWVGFRITQFVRATIWAEAALYGWLRVPNVPLHFITAQPDVIPISLSRHSSASGR